MRYYRRWNPAGEVFYIDEKGNRVSEVVAKTNLVQESGQRVLCSATTLLESSNSKRDLASAGLYWEPVNHEKQKLVDAFKQLGLSDKEAELAASF